MYFVGYQYVKTSPFFVKICELVKSQKIGHD